MGVQKIFVENLLEKDGTAERKKQGQHSYEEKCLL